MSDALNLTGMLCPMPVLKTKKALAKVAAGDVVTVLTDDPHAVEDLRLFCEQSGHVLLSQKPVEGSAGVTEHQIQHRA